MMKGMGAGHAPSPGHCRMPVPGAAPGRDLHPGLLWAPLGPAGCLEMGGHWDLSVPALCPRVHCAGGLLCPVGSCARWAGPLPGVPPGTEGLPQQRDLLCTGDGAGAAKATEEQQFRERAAVPG